MRGRACLAAPPRLPEPHKHVSPAQLHHTAPADIPPGTPPDTPSDTPSDTNSSGLASSHLPLTASSPPRTRVRACILSILYLHRVTERGAAGRRKLRAAAGLGAAHSPVSTHSYTPPAASHLPPSHRPLTSTPAPHPAASAPAPLRSAVAHIPAVQRAVGPAVLALVPVVHGLLLDNGGVKQFVNLGEGQRGCGLTLRGLTGVGLRGGPHFAAQLAADALLAMWRLRYGFVTRRGPPQRSNTTKKPCRAAPMRQPRPLHDPYPPA